jgi:hypothetical protein
MTIIWDLKPMMTSHKIKQKELLHLNRIVMPKLQKLLVMMSLLKSARRPKQWLVSTKMSLSFVSFLKKD